MWVEMIRQYADAERSLAPGDRAMFPNADAEAMIRDGAAVQIDGPDGERTDRTELRTRPVPQPPRGRRAQAPKQEGQGDGGAAGQDGQGDSTGTGGDGDTGGDGAVKDPIGPASKGPSKDSAGKTTPPGK
ncbi:hypothetical protein ACLQ2R_03205 [Streptosporangium sp. DT93]|uniref:hypothetical protein n=1 Tax=Streptosporangium sp. DT93 TaxID=3393428 RepID=UPI003CEBB531